MKLGDFHKGSKDFTIEYNGSVQINRMEGSAETWSGVGGGGRIAFFKPWRTATEKSSKYKSDHVTP